MRRVVLFLILLVTPSAYAQDLFDQSIVRDFYFDFAQQNWWNQLDSGLELQGDLTVDGVAYPSIGLQIKGASSSLVPGFKQPFNLKLDSFVPGQELYGFTTLNLNNGAVDPTLTREVISYEILRDYVPAPKTAYVRIHINGTYWGIYILIEQPNKNFLREWFRDDEGTRYKADDPGGTRVESSTLQWFGSSPSNYSNKYELKTQGHPNAWTDLITMIDKLNNTSDPVFKAEIESYINIDRVLWYLASMNMMCNSDEYMGAGHNYYMYFNPDDGRMNMIPWDLNESYGVHYPQTNPWLYPITYRGNSNTRPLFKRLLEDPEWRELYFAHYRTVMASWSDWDTVIGPLNQQYQDLIRQDVLADTNYLYPNHFDPSFNGRFWAHFHWVHGLTEVTLNREIFLLTQPDLIKPEPQIDFVTLLTPSPQSGDDVWVSAQVSGTPAIQNVFLRSGRVGEFDRNPMFDDGLHFDGASGDGVYGGSFVAGPPLSTMRYYIQASDIAGTIQVHPLKAEINTHTVQVEPGGTGGPILINELIADNDTGDMDEAGDFDDWLELYNNSDQPYDLSGHYLSDDPGNPTLWSFPTGTIIPARGFLRIWADDEPTEGLLHATFKLSKDGESLLLSDSDAQGNNVLDSIVWLDQGSDRAFGRVPDGGDHRFYVWDPSGEAPLVNLGESNRYDARLTGSSSGFDLDVSGNLQVGFTFAIDLSSGVPNTNAILLVGLGPKKIDTPALGPLLIDFQNAVLIQVSLDSLGNGALSSPIPSLLGGLQIYAQALSGEFSNAAIILFSP